MVRAFDPGAKVQEGQWVKGPDGRLDMDVSVRGTVDGTPRLAVIECKDFNRASTGKVGREVVDALDSKRLDLNAHTAIICSNSGFTQDALNKAARKHIGMISVLRIGDGRAKAVIEEACHILRVTFAWESWRLTFTDLPNDLAPIDPLDVRFAERPVALWLQWKAQQFAIANPSLRDAVKATFTFKKPLPCSCKGTAVQITSAAVEFAYETEWRAQTVRLDASMGLYDYIRGRVRMPLGANQYTIGVDYDGGLPCAPPEVLPEAPPGPGEVRVCFTRICNILGDAGPMPDLDPFVIPEDLEPFPLMSPSSWIGR